MEIYSVGDPIMTGLQLVVKCGNLGTVELLVNLSKSHEQLVVQVNFP